MFDVLLVSFAARFFFAPRSLRLQSTAVPRGGRRPAVENAVVYDVCAAIRGQPGWQGVGRCVYRVDAEGWWGRKNWPLLVAAVPME